jgi:DNA (cytosine-5)-methyltransferase 1
MRYQRQINAPSVAMSSEYKLPTMEEINGIPFNGVNVVSTFSGAGGSCLGYRMAGCRVLWANEFIPRAQEVYKLNHPNSILNCEDIRDVNGADILNAIGLDRGEIDILDGSPPCAAFSTSGDRDESWGKKKKYSDTTQRVDDLFFEYTRLLRELQPKMFVAENVKGLILGKAKGYFKLILQAMRDCGYQVSAKLLNAKWLGVPQSRERLIFVGCRNDLGREPRHPKPFGPLIPLKVALSDLGDNPDVPQNINWITTTSAPALLARYLLAHRGERFGTTCARHGLYVSGHMHKRLDWKEVSPTIVQSSPVLYHPDVPRYLSIVELKRIMSYPDDFDLQMLQNCFGTNLERIGRSVPPLMMKQIAQTCSEVLNECK